MYYFSALDPNFRIKGSRDPLGFQTIWSGKGREVVAHLSTVSSSLADFMILAYATYFHKDKDPKYFLNLFIKFEQACAYARRHFNNEESFNGATFVGKNIGERADQNAFSCSLHSKDTILSNQRAYGVYGKYVRPFRDMGIAEDESFSSIMEEALEKTDKNQLLSIVERMNKNKEVVLTADELKIVADLIKQPTPDEKSLYRKYILEVPHLDHCQKNLYQVLKNSNIPRHEFHLYSFIRAVQDHPEAGNELKEALAKIEDTERILYPMNQGFTYMLNTPYWDLQSILEDPVLDGINTTAQDGFPEDQTMQKLQDIFTLDKSEKIRQIVERNKQVCERRGSRAWIEQEPEGYRVLYGENGQNIDQIDYEQGYGYPYFLPTYLSLFNQIDSN